MLAFSFSFPFQAEAESSGAANEDLLLRSEQNRVWLESMPDYQWRLYDRITAIKNRQIVQEREIVFGLSILALLILGLFAWVSRVSRSAPRRQPTEGSQPLPPRDRLLWGAYRLQMGAIANRQKKIEALCLHLEEALQERHATDRRIGEVLALIRQEKSTLDQELNRVSDQLP